VHVCISVHTVATTRRSHAAGGAGRYVGAAVRSPVSLGAGAGWGAAELMTVIQLLDAAATRLDGSDRGGSACTGALVMMCHGARDGSPN